LQGFAEPNAAGWYPDCVAFPRGTAMTTITIRGHYKNQTFIPDQPLPAGEGRAELTIETDLATLIAHPPPTPRLLSVANPTPERFRELLAELASGPETPVLPADFSRADLYEDDLAKLIANPPPTPRLISVAKPTREEFEKFLQEFPLAGLPPLPPDFSPSDLYEE
jgi:hypothetical protein